MEQKLKIKISEIEVAGYYPTPQYENYGNTSAIVSYAYSEEQENKMWEEQKQKLLEEIENNDFLDWDEVNKYWERLMENEKLLKRVKRILSNKIERL